MKGALGILHSAFIRSPRHRVYEVCVHKEADKVTYSLLQVDRQDVGEDFGVVECGLYATVCVGETSAPPAGLSNGSL